MGSVNGYHHLSHETNGTDGMGSVNGYHHLSHETNGTDGRYHSDGMHDKNTSPGPPEAIAIVGLSCRFPGDATSPDKFWDMCAEGRSAWTPIPEERFNAKAFYHPQGEKQYTTNVIGGHFLREDLALFDAAFFNISSEVASTMDPQCRLQFESVFEGLESAGIPMEKVVGSNTSVYAGAFFRDFMDSYMRDPEAFPRYVVTGNSANMLSNRISHWFDFRGPSMTVDTGCSSGLSALHLACHSLRSGESSMAIVGGANVMFNPDIFILMSSLGFLSPDGRSYAFDSRAAGYGRGEGVGTLVLKTHKAALRDGDPIRAIIRETGLNQDGKTPTITSPSQTAQEDLMRRCYDSAGIDPATIAYVEAHGTGTQAGDPIEAAAIDSVFGRNRGSDSPVFIGSVKTNIGHLEPASGFASVIKVALALERGFIPPSINFNSPNTKLELEKSHLKVPTELMPWPRGFLKRASINNFGYGGSNAHVIMEGSHLEEYLNGTSLQSDVTDSRKSRVFLLSAKDEAAATAMAINMQKYLRQSKHIGKAGFLDNLAYTLAERRSIFDWTIAVPARDTSDLAAALESSEVKPVRAMDHVPRLGFVFTGQGAQWYAMGRELIDAYPVFKETLLEAERHLQEFGAKFSLIEELTKSEEESCVNDAVLSPLLSVAVQIALVQLLGSWGILPTAVTSHSSGEVAAAFAAKAIDIREAMFILYSRGILLDSLRKKSALKGSMMAVGAEREVVERYISEVAPHGLVIACLNSPSSITVSGDSIAINELGKKLSDAKVFARKLKVNVAFHSHHMKPLEFDYLQALQKGLKKRAIGDIIYSSPVTGNVVPTGEILPSEHWTRSMLQPVLFSDALASMCVRPDPSRSRPVKQVDILIEIGPHSALAGPVRQTLASPALKGLDLLYSSALIRDKDAVETMQSLVCFLAGKGYRSKLDCVNLSGWRDKLEVLTDLPSYPWTHQTRHWLEPRLNKDHRFKRHPTHEFLGSAMDGEHKDTPKWRHIIRASDMPWIHDHRVQSDIIYPGAGFICMAIQAIHQLATAETTPHGYLLEDVEILKAVVVPNTPVGIEVQLTLKRYTERDLGREGWYDFSITSVMDGDVWTEHCKGRIAVQDEKKTHTFVCKPFGRENGSFIRSIDPQDLYSSLRAVGVYHGPSFQNILRIQANKRQSLSTFAIAETGSMMPAEVEQPHVIHPTTLDSVFLATYSALYNVGSKQSSAMVPRSIKRMFVSCAISSRPGYRYDAQATLHTHHPQGFRASVFIGGTDGDPALAVDGLYCQSLGDVSAHNDQSAYTNRALTIHWAPDMDLNPPSIFEGALRHAPVQSERMIVAELRQACYHFIHDALEALTDEDLEQLLWHHKAMFAWMQAQEHKASLNLLGDTSSDWSRASKREKELLVERVSRASIDGRMSCRIGKSLVSIFRREVAPLQIMLEDKLLYDYYRQALRIDRSYEQIKQLIDVAAHKNPKARVLEIGGGTGGCTVHALQVLGGGNSGRPTRFAHYDFTDISSGFFEMARQKFEAWGDLIHYTKLDVEVDPVAQGFEEGSYDLILACQVLHATKNMCRTLQNVRKLLRPGGKLMMIETTNDAIDIQIIFGTLPGWWLSEESERKTSPSLSVGMWDQTLRTAGFSGLDIEVKDCEDPHYVMSAMMSTATELNSPQFDSDIIIIPLVNDVRGPALEDLRLRLTTQTKRKTSIASLKYTEAEGKICLFIDSADSVLGKLDVTQFENIRRLLTTSHHTMWVSRGATGASEEPYAALHIGLLRTLRCENSQTSYISLDLDPRRQSWTDQCLDTVVEVFTTVFDIAHKRCQQDNEFSERSGIVRVSRIMENEIESKAITAESTAEEQLFFQTSHELRLDASNPGMLDSLVFRDVTGQSEVLPANFVEIKPMAFGLNFRDVMVALGQLDLAIMGLECSGIVTQVGSSVDNGLQVGDNVCGLIRGHWANRVRVDCKCMTTIPVGMDFATAASVPLVFTTAYYSLIELARLQPGETVLIHCGAGGVGQAAIMLAKHLGGEVFATAGTPHKRSFLCKKYDLSPDHVFSSRDSSFVTGISSITKDKGVDVVLNSLSGSLLQETWKCIAPFGRFVEIGKRDLESNHNLEMEPFTRNVSFISVDMIMVGAQRRDLVAKMLTQVMRLFDEKKISVVSPLTSWPLSDLQKAFRSLQSGKMQGKLVLCPGEEEMVKVLPQQRSPRLVSSASYVLVGGSGGLGRAIARLLVECGARHLILLSRNAQSHRHIEFYNDLRAAGCDVVARNCNIVDKADLARALNECIGMPPVRGVIQGAMVLQDSVFERMSFEDYQAAVGPKVHGSWNLHQQFHSSPLDFFIMLSSMTGVAGNPSQANYAAGGSFQDALARHRSAHGLPGVSLDLGMVRSVGYVAATAGVSERMLKNGYRFVEDAEVMGLIQGAICEPLRAPDASQVMIGIASGSGAEWGSAPWREDARFSGLCLAQQSSSSEAAGAGGVSSGLLGRDIQARLREAATWPDAVGAVCDALVAKLAEMFSLPAQEIDRGTGLARYGVDSLVAVELRNWLGHMLQAQLSIFDIMQSASLVGLAEKVAAKSRLVNKTLIEK